VQETPFERVLAITRDILREQELQPALESIALAIRDVFRFKYVTIVAADTPGADLTRRVMLGWPPELIATRIGESVLRANILEVLKPHFEVVENKF
jgi:hypothetical protein